MCVCMCFIKSEQCSELSRVSPEMYVCLAAIAAISRGVGAAICIVNVVGQQAAAAAA